MENSKYFKDFQNSEYGEGLLLDERNGVYSLISANKKKDQVYMQWVYPQKRDGSKQPMAKSLPWKIKLGDSKDEAFQTLRYFAGLLMENKQVPSATVQGIQPAKPIPPLESQQRWDVQDDDIPF